MRIFSSQKISSQDWNFDYVICSIEDLFSGLHPSDGGLSHPEAAPRLIKFGSNEPARKRKRTVLFHFVSKLANPLVVVLLGISAFSYFFGEKISAGLVAA